jgi:hypothetical protein
MLIIAWCKFSQELLEEYKSLAGHLYKHGELTENIFFAKIDGDMEKDLAQENYQVEGFPAVFVVQ